MPRKKSIQNASTFEKDLFNLNERRLELKNAIAKCYDYFAYQEEIMEKHGLTIDQFFDHPEYRKIFDKIERKCSRIQDKINHYFHLISVEIVHNRMTQFQDWINFHQYFKERELKLIDRNDGIIFKRKKNRY